MSLLNRRDFIKDSAVLAAIASAGVVGEAAAAAKSEKAAKSANLRRRLPHRGYRRPRPWSRTCAWFCRQEQLYRHLASATPIRPSSARP